MYGCPKPLRRLAAAGILTSAALVLLPEPASEALEEVGPVRIGILANRGAEACLEKWKATADYLTAHVPERSFVVDPLAYDEVGAAAKRGDVDFILANPSLYVELERLYGASRIATLKNLHLGKPYTVYAGVMFCRSDREDLQHLADLKGKSFMGVAEDAFGGWQMAWRELKEQGINPDRDFGELRFGRTHDAVVYAVREGKVDAGTVRADTLERMAAEGKIRLEEFRVIGRRGGEEPHLPFPRSTRAYPEWPFAKARHVSDELAQQVAIALMAMPPEAPAARAAQCAGWVIPQNYQPVHECLKELGIGPYRDYGKVTLGAAVRRYWPWLVVAAALLVLSSLVSVYLTRLNRRLAYALEGQKRELGERLRAEEALRKSEQFRVESEKLAAIGRLAAGVAHEINNLLTGVLTFTHLLRQKENLDEQDKQDLDLVIHETNRVSEIARGLLEFARERPPVKERLILNDVIRRTLRLLGNQKAFQQITVRENLEESLPSVDGDVNQLQQVMLNLLLNACEAMPHGGALTVSTSARDQTVLVEVADTGCGIKREHLDRIFEPLFTTKPVGKGTGLGLSVTHGIVQQHGATIEVESEEGEGTKFTVIFPAG